jgi:alpha-tubulin suppressor-like RCC1 family protein
MFGTAALQAACTESSGPAVPELQVTFTNSADSVFYGHRMQGWVHTYTDARTIATDSVRWTSSDTLVAVVDQTGSVLGVGIGAARIVVDRQGGRGEKAIRVVAYEPVPDQRFSLLSRGIDGVCAQAEGGGVFCGVCVEQQGGSIYCGSVPASDTVPPFAELPGSRAHRFTSLHTSNRSQCGLAEDDRAYCWGQNAAGHFGTGDRMSTRYSDAPAVVAAGRRFSGFSVGGHAQTCAIGLSDPTLYCFGHNDAGQVGRGTLSGFDSTYAPVLGQLQARMVATGGVNTCAVDLRGELYCWGSRYGPSFEQMEERTAGVPIHLIGAPAFSTLSIGMTNICGLDASGAAWCWSRIPEPVDTPLRFASLAAGLRSTCGAEASGDLSCWGRFHPLTVSDRLPPTDAGIHRVARGEQFRDVATGWDYACGITLDGRLLCW